MKGYRIFQLLPGTTHMKAESESYIVQPAIYNKFPQEYCFV